MLYLISLFGILALVVIPICNTSTLSKARQEQQTTE
jgi:hypothetical protein